MARATRERSRAAGSAALRRWEGERAADLDRIEAAHTSLRSVPGRRAVASQIQQAYAVLLASHFQGFCRDLHSECIERVARGVSPALLGKVLLKEFSFARRLDRGTPSPGNVGADFERLGIDFWPAVLADDPRNERRRSSLALLCVWRNAIAHQDFPSHLRRHALALATVRSWRASCRGLARSFDRVARRYVAEVAEVRGFDPGGRCS